MNQAELAAYRTRLLEERKRLQADVKQLIDSALEATSDELSRLPTHIADLGSETYSQELALSLAPAEERAVDLIDRALDRIENGTYGTCERCGQPIAKARLDALPFAPYCIGCAQALEKAGSAEQPVDAERRKSADRSRAPRRSEPRGSSGS